MKLAKRSAWRVSGKMKTVVVYKSSTGFTKTYAEWIADELKCDIMDLKAVKGNELDGYEVVIYGGWIMGNMITGLDKINKMNLKKLVVFAVGSMPGSDTVVENIKLQNKLGDAHFFYMPGGFHFEELNFMIRTMLKTMKKSIAKKADKTEADLYMEKNLGTSFDNSDRKYTELLIQYVKEEIA